VTGETQYRLYRVAHGIVNAMPRRAAYWMANRLADVQYDSRRMDRDAVTDNLRMVLGEHHPDLSRHARGVFRSFGKYLVDFLTMDRLDRQSLRRYVTFRGFEAIRQTLSGRQGVIALTAHVGNWELAGVAIALQQKVRVTAVALDHAYPKVNEFFLSRRRRHGLESVPLGQAFKVCLRRLKECSVVGLLGDRNFGDHGVTVPLFGQQTALPRGPAMLSVLTGAPIVPCFMVRQADDEFLFCTEPPIAPRASADREDEVVRLTMAYAGVMERYIRRYPDQWCMFRRFWVEDQRVERLRARTRV